MNNAPHLVLCDLGKPEEAHLESYSPFCLKTHRALLAAGFSYETKRASRPSEYSKWNPTGRAPVLLVDGEPITDSSRILAWICDRAPEAISSSAEEWILEDWADTSLNGFLVAARWADERNWSRVKQAYFGSAPALVRALIAPKVRRHVLAGLVARDVMREGSDACWTRFSETIDRLDTRVRKDAFFSGARLSVADIAIFGQLGSLRTSLTPWQAGEIAERPALTRYLDRVQSATTAKAQESAGHESHGSHAAAA